jgi:arginine decarboxylase
VGKLLKSGKINKDTYVLCNGFKRAQYIDNIAQLINDGHDKTIPIIDNYEELDLLQAQVTKKI